MSSLKFIPFVLIFSNILSAQSTSCSTNPMYRQFDFWVGEWEVFRMNGAKAGDSKISLILDSCVVLEEWKSISQQNSKAYAGKSFNTYNSSSMQWQQQWVDNFGGSNNYNFGNFKNNTMELLTDPFVYSKDTMAIRKMTFTKIDSNKIIQHGQIEKSPSKIWTTEYQLEYRRKPKQVVEYDSILAKQLGADDYGMRSYVLVVLKTGSKVIEDKAEVSRIFKGHMENIGKLANEKKLALAGPFPKKQNGFRGLYIFAVNSIEEAEALTKTDPAVESGLLQAEYYNWYGSAALMNINQEHNKISKTKF